MRRLSLGLMTLLLLLVGGALAPGTTQGSDPLSISMPDTGAKPGAKVTVGIEVAGVETNDSVYSYELDLSFDPAILLLDSLSRVGTVTWSTASIVNNYDTTAGSMRIAVSSASGPLEGDGVLLYLFCEVLAAAVPETTSPLQFDRVMFNEGTPGAVTTDGLLTVLLPTGFDVEPPYLNLGIIPAGMTDTATFQVINSTPHSEVILESRSLANPYLALSPMELPDTLDNPGDPSRTITVACAPTNIKLINDQIKLYSSTGSFETVVVEANADAELFYDVVALKMGGDLLPGDVADSLDANGNNDGKPDLGDLMVIMRGLQPEASGYAPGVLSDEKGGAR